MKQLKRAITVPYAGAVCPKCGQGMNNKQNVIMNDTDEKRNRKRYGRDICDDCKIEIIQERIQK